MKKSFLLMSVLASLFMAGCSQEDFVPNSEGENKNSEVQTSYLSVNLMSSDGTGTRAAISGGYENGSTVENKVTSVRFYFFAEDGSAANIKRNGTSYINYFDWTPTEQTSTTSGTNVESRLSATIVINTENGDKLPYSMAAVLNPTETFKAKNYYSLQALQTQRDDYADSKFTVEGKFVMFNSVYGNDDNTEVCAVPIEAENLQTTTEDAMAHPINIYVERCVAKVRVNLDASLAAATTDKLLLKDKNGNNLTITEKQGETRVEKQVYLKLGGWHLTAETNRSRLIKKTNPTAWASMTWWNNPSDYRSCWAINSAFAENKYVVDYNDINTSFGRNTALYTNENAAPATDADGEPKNLNKTKVLLHGQLCDAEGNPFTIVRHRGFHMADTYSDVEADNLPELKHSILEQLRSNNVHYYYASENGRKEIDVDDIKIVIAKQKEEEDSENNCYVYAQLTKDAADKTWYASTDQTELPLVGEGEKTVADLINENLRNKDNVDWALVWKSGMTYYYYEILHNGSTPGVVRNHVYETTVTNIAGLGTPVYNPEEVIYPEKPDPNDHYVAARINILSWHIVNGNYNLVW